MADKRLMDQLEGVLSKLRASVTVTERYPGAVLETGERVPEDLMDGICQQSGSRIWLPLRQPDLILSCSAETENASDLLTLAEALAIQLGSADGGMESVYDVYRRTLRGELSATETETLAGEHRMPLEMRRCVLVFHVMQTGAEKAFDLLRTLTPLEEKDVLIDMDRHTVALIKDMESTDSADDMIQYAEALQETLMSETARQMTVGIGDSCDTLADLKNSYEEARRAIEVGHLFHPESSVFVFSTLVLERFLMELPADISAYYHGLLFNRKTSRLFNEEMLYTIDMFFRKDLNLSDAARQLYIHRNTLVYRLDKIQRQTGLDLRRFDDAVTFKILMELKKCSNGRK